MAAYNYSTEEQRIGTWIDGKPLYQKTVVKTWDEAIVATNSDYNQTKRTGNGFNNSSFITDISNALNARVVDFSITETKNYYNPLGDHSGNYSKNWNTTVFLSNNGTWITDDGKYVYVDWTEGGAISSYNNQFKSDTKFIMTIQYTKTTD